MQRACDGLCICGTFLEAIHLHTMHAKVDCLAPTLCWPAFDAMCTRAVLHKGQAADRATADPFFENSSLAEQSNKQLTKLKTAAAHMNQFTLLWRIRHMLYSINKAVSQQWRRR